MIADQCRKLRVPLSYGFNTKCNFTHRLFRCAATPPGTQGLLRGARSNSSLRLSHRSCYALRAAALPKETRYCVRPAAIIMCRTELLRNRVAAQRVELLRTPRSNPTKGRSCEPPDLDRPGRLRTPRSNPSLRNGDATHSAYQPSLRGGVAAQHSNRCVTLHSVLNTKESVGCCVWDITTLSPEQSV